MPHSREEVGEGESMCMRACSYKCRQICLYGVQKTTLGANTQSLAYFFFETRSFTGLKFIKQSTLARHLSPEIIHLCLPSVKLFTSTH